MLILGESGTGKEQIANAIQQLSRRKNQPFIKVNCAALPLSLIESELLGVPPTTLNSKMKKLGIRKEFLG